MGTRLDTMDNLDFTQEYTPELSNLKTGLEGIEIKNQEEFESLLQDPILQGAFEKLSDQMNNKAFGKEREKLNNVNVSKTLKMYENKYPGLRLYIQFLGLENLGNFKDLTSEQKRNFMALNTALKTGKTTEDIIRKTKELQERYSKKMSVDLGWTHIKNFLQLKKSLKDYGLNEEEIQKFEKLVNLIDKTTTIKNKIIEEMAERLALMYGPGWRRMCSVSAWLIVAAAVAFFGLGYLTCALIEKSKAKPWEKMDSFTRSTGMREILQWASYEDNNSTTLQERTGVFEIDKDAGLLERIWKGTVNYIENKEIIMEVRGTVKAQFDLLNDGCNGIVNYDSGTGKRKIDVYLPEPKLVTQDVSMQVLHESGRELIKIEEWENIHGKMLEKGKEELINRAKENKIIEKSKESIEHQIKAGIENLFGSVLINEDTGFTSLEVNVYFPGEGQSGQPGLTIPPRN